MSRLIEKAFEGCNTDKIRLGYLPAYQHAFTKYRTEVKTFLEIGVHEGESLLAWRNYFPNAQIVGVEIKSGVVKIGKQDRIDVHIGDATDEDFIDKLITKYKYFDIILDDGSHESADIRKSFHLLWPYVQYIYCIEDLETQFPNSVFPNKSQRPFGNRFIPDGKPFNEDLKKMIRKNIFRMAFYKWQAYIYADMYIDETKKSFPSKDYIEHIDKILQNPQQTNLFGLEFFNKRAYLYE